MNKKIKPPDEKVMINCPAQGKPVNFLHCSKENKGMPCHRALDCWYSHFQVKEFFRQELSDHEWLDAFGEPVRPKVLNHMDVLKLEQKRADKESQGKMHN
jgi:hypothetical protein